MIRSTDPALVNRLAAAQGQDGDFTEFLSDPLHVCLIEGKSGALFAFRGPGIYEVHVFFDVRGAKALWLGETMLGWMREKHGARLFWSLIPVESRKVLMFARLMGWESHGIVESRHGWQELFSSGDA
jgi:hypothetical protein